MQLLCCTFRFQCSTDPFIIHLKRQRRGRSQTVHQAQAKKNVTAPPSAPKFLEL
jgi:hypothetical protein